jgi:hypothetical protein
MSLEMKMTYQQILKLTNKELAAILITCDGAGKDIKEEVLEELLNRRYLDGLADANKI